MGLLLHPSTLARNMFTIEDGFIACSKIPNCSSRDEYLHRSLKHRCNRGDRMPAVDATAVEMTRRVDHLSENLRIAFTSYWKILLQTIHA